MREKLHNLIDTIQEEKLLRKIYPGLEGVDVNSVYPLFHF